MAPSWIMNQTSRRLVVIAKAYSASSSSRSVASVGSRSIRSIGRRSISSSATTAAAVSSSSSSSLSTSSTNASKRPIASNPNNNITSNSVQYHRHHHRHQQRLSSRSSVMHVRSFSSSGDNVVDDDGRDEGTDEQRESMAFDVLVVGGGPAGLGAAIRLKQLCVQHGTDLSVCVIDKGSEIGAHILSGNVFDPKALEELFPQYSSHSSDGGGDKHWTEVFFESQGSYATPVRHDQFQVLTEGGSAYTIPNILLPSQLHNEGNYIISLSQLCRWLAKEAEELGVEIYPGFAASEVLLNEKSRGGGVKGVATRDVGIAKDGSKKSTYEPGVELHARQTLFAEGARGSCSEFLMKHFELRDGPGQDVHTQTYGLGIKEVWEVPDDVFKKGFVQHTLGYPLQSSPTDDVFGGTFLYHQEPNLVLAGLVVGLDYKNPYLNPYKEFQRWKTHPQVKKHFEGGTCISYGARVLNEGGFHAIPKLTFPGGALVGCSAGFLNAVKIKGSHTALKSGMLAAEAVFEGLQAEEGVEPVAETFALSDDYIPQELTSYSDKFQNSWIYDELYQVRNCHQAFSKWGIGGGLVYTGLATHITKGREPWTLKHDKRDADCTGEAAKYKEIEYPAPDGKLTFDLLTNLQRSGTYHADDQPAHLRIKPEKASIPKDVSLQTYGGPEQRFCPAAVYEYVDADDDSDSGSADKRKQLVINAQNCVHCKCCSIKMPDEYINWTVPEGGGGPQYQVM